MSAQAELALSYTLGAWVWAKANGHNNRRMLARIQSEQPIRTAHGEVWLVRCYYSPYKRIARPGWASVLEHRRIDRELNAAELADAGTARLIAAAPGVSS